MKICIVGAGAVGGFLGAKLAAAGVGEVSAIARGATLAALQAHGWRARTADGLVHGPAQATADPSELGPQEVVVIAVKGPALPAVAPTLAPLLDTDTLVVPAMNGVPWWFCHGRADVGDAPLESVDPGGIVGASIPFAHVIGCVVHLSAEQAEPGVVQHRMGQGIIVGEPLGGHSERVAELARTFTDGGFDVTDSGDVRSDIWYKLWGNLTMNPVSAITGATTDLILADPLVRALCTSAMVEAATVGRRIGCPISQTPEERSAMTAALGAFRTSMLQDAEAGRPLELDSIVTAVREIAQRLGEPTPHIDALLGLTRLFARTHGLLA